jgi:hypothetical protein
MKLGSAVPVAPDLRAGDNDVRMRSTPPEVGPDRVSKCR